MQSVIQGVNFIMIMLPSIQLTTTVIRLTAVADIFIKQRQQCFGSHKLFQNLATSPSREAISPPPETRGDFVTASRNRMREK